MLGNRLLSIEQMALDLDKPITEEKNTKNQKIVLVYRFLSVGDIATELEA